jgi:hypothetical protein
VSLHYLALTGAILVIVAVLALGLRAVLRSRWEEAERWNGFRKKKRPEWPGIC